MLYLMCIPILFAIASITNSESNSENYYNVKRLVRGTNDYNHPPSVFSVPVAIVYEDDNQQEKTLQSTVSSTQSKDQYVDSLTTTEATTQTEMTNKILRAQFRVSNEMDTGPYADNQYNIPVAVIYDEEPEINYNKPTRQPKTQKILKNGRKDDDTEHKNKNPENTVITEFPKRTQGRDPIVPIIQSDNYVFSDSGDFHYSYEGGDGTKAFMRGELRSLDDNVGQAVEGSFSYIGKDGNDYSLIYTADENGYRPIGSHLPTPPPIPPAIARALKYLATKTTPQPVTESL